MAASRRKPQLSMERSNLVPKELCTMSLRTRSMVTLWAAMSPALTVFLGAGSSFAQGAPAARPPAPAAAAPAAPAAAAPAAGVAAAPAATLPLSTTGQPAAFDLREAPGSGLGSGSQALLPQPGGLTAEQVAKKAVAASPTVVAKQAEIDAAAARVDQAIVTFLPKLKASATYRRVSPVSMSFGTGSLVGAMHEGAILSGEPGKPVTDSQGSPIGAQSLAIKFMEDQFSLQASLSLPLSDYVLRMSNAITGAKTSMEAAELGKKAEILKNATDARLAYYNWLRAVAAVAVAESSLTRTQALRGDAQAAFNVGSATRADVMRLEAVVATTELAIAEAKTMKGLTQEQLAMLMGEPTRDYAVGEDVLSPAPILPDQPTDQLVEEAYRNRLELQAIGKALQSYDDGIKALKVSRYPRLDAFADTLYGRPNPNFIFQGNLWKPSWAVGISLSYSPNDTLATNVSMRDYQTQRQKLASDELNARRGIRMEASSAELDHRKSKVAATTSIRGYESAREAYRVARDLYRVGRATTTDLISAESELVMAEMRQINAAIDTRVARVKLEHALGRDTQPTRH